MVASVWVSDPEGKKIAEMKVMQSGRAWPKSGVGFMSGRQKRSSCGGDREALRADGGCSSGSRRGGLSGHLKALDWARDRFRMSQSKSDSFDAYALAEFGRTYHVHLRALELDSAPAQELKMLTWDHDRLMR